MVDVSLGGDVGDISTSGVVQAFEAVAEVGQVGFHGYILIRGAREAVTEATTPPDLCLAQV